MNQPVLLVYNMSEDQLAKVRLSAMRLKIRLRPVAPQECTLPLISLLDAPKAAQSTVAMSPFDGEMLVMANFPAGMLQAFLTAMRRAGAHPVALKAVLTQTNAQWDSVRLHDELLAEHQTMHSGKDTPLHGQ